MQGLNLKLDLIVNQLQFIDAQTGLLPGPWMTYLNESEVDDNGYITISFGALENSPNNAPEEYYLTEELVGLELVLILLLMKIIIKSGPRQTYNL